MRPVRLEMDGFASYREKTVVDFTGADYFALIGPTGSGKSTVIDALTFALFGTVPRWDDRRVVRDALAPTANRGTVRLVFDVDGLRFIAARELTRAPRGAVHMHGRLEQLADPSTLGDVDDPTEVLAADSEVTAAVEELLGLTYEHFTKCVVLPQGEFDQFLRARGSDRRTMLLKLLGFDLYADIQKMANNRATAAEGRADWLADQVTRHGDATPEAEAAAAARVAELEALAGEVDTALPALTAAAEALTAALQRSAALTAEAEQLGAVAVPDGVDELDAQRRAAERELAEARTGEEAAAGADTAARTMLSAAPARAPLEAARRDYAERDRRRGALSAAESAVTDAARVLDEATAAHRQAAAAMEEARTRRDAAAGAARTANDDVTRLTAELALLRGIDVPADLAALDERDWEARRELADAETAMTDAEAAEEAARSALSSAPARAPLERARDGLTELAAARAAIEPLADAHTTAAAKHTEAEEALRAAEAALVTARAHRDAAAVADSAAAMRAHLVAGEPCPVCEQPVATLPAAADDGALAAAERAVTDAQTALAGAQTVERAAARATADAAGRLVAATGRVDTLRTALAAALAGRPEDPAAVQAELGRLDALEADVRATGDALRAARATRAAAAQRLAKADADAAARRAEFDAARDPLVPLGAPAAGAGPLTDRWTRLAEWARAEADARAATLVTATQVATETTRAAAAAEERFAAAEADATARRAAETVATGAHGSAAAELRGLQTRLAELAEALADAPAPEEVVAALTELDRLELACHAADEALRAARGRRARAQATVDALAQRVAIAWQQLRAARDRLVVLGAPELPDGAVLDAWSTLLAWARAEAAARIEQLPAAQSAVTEASAHHAQLEKELAELLAGHGVAADETQLTGTARAAVAAAHAAAAAQVRRIAERRAEAAALSAQHQAAVAAGQVARTLGNLLHGRNFPKWLETAALDALVLAASESLAELSGGQFELTHRDGDFFVVDHADADSLRSVRTLSGGETFQASLALALALSSQLSTLAASGAARLDSIFLDEGFGTLDETTLDVVAATLENLAAGERMVGIITHVPALAERVPVRYVVRRDARTSTLVRDEL